MKEFRYKVQANMTDENMHFVWSPFNNETIPHMQMFSHIFKNSGKHLLIVDNGDHDDARFGPMSVVLKTQAFVDTIGQYLVPLVKNASLTVAFQAMPAQPSRRAGKLQLMSPLNTQVNGALNLFYCKSLRTVGIECINGLQIHLPFKENPRCGHHMLCRERYEELVRGHSGIAAVQQILHNVCV